MNENETSPLEYFEQVSKQWEAVKPDIYLERQDSKKIDRLLNKIMDDVCDIERHPIRCPDDEFMQAVNASNVIINGRRLLRKFTVIRDNTTHREDDNPNFSENLNVLISGLRCLFFAVRKKYSLSQPSLPEHRAHMTIRNDHPTYPSYPDGTLTGDELIHLYNIRDGLENVRKADIILESLPEGASAVKELSKRHSSSILYIGIDPEQTKEEIDDKLQRHYSSLYNEGVALLSRAFGVDGVDNAMDKEADAIEKFLATSKSAVMARK